MAAASGAAAATFKLGDETVSTYNDEHFAHIRGKWGLGDDFLAAFDISKMTAGGGKGGQLMAFTPDKLYLVKEVNETDQNTLMKIVPKYAEHLCHEEGSLLARFFVHFQRKGKNFIVMNNWLPPPRYDAAPADLPFDLRKNYNQFDLKGCADDKTLKALGRDVEPVHKRIFNVLMWAGDLFWTKARHRYYEGKCHARETVFHVAPAAHDEISKRTARDVKFLQECGLMDYSLVVSYHALPKASLDVATTVYAGTSDCGAQPYIASNEKQILIVYVGIIDYLQDWTWKKEVAQCIKVLECNKATIPPQAYGDRFATFVDGKFVADCEAV